MSGNRLFLDTNIVLYLFSGDKTLGTILNNKQLYISFITELELLSFKKLSKKEDKVLREFIEQCTVIDINSQIKEGVIKLRSAYQRKLPDCIIMASSIYLDVPIITADNDFKEIDEINLLFYEKGSN